MDKDIVTKSNAIITASYRLSLIEKQIILYGLSLINPFDKEFPIDLKIDALEFAEKFSKKYNSFYPEIKKAILKRFWERYIQFIDEEDHIVKIRWLTQVKYIDNKGYFIISFSEKIKPYLLQMAKNFTSYFLSNIKNLKSFYSIRIYEFCIMQINKFKNDTVYLIFNINEFKTYLKINDKYPRYYS